MDPFPRAAMSDDIFAAARANARGRLSLAIAGFGLHQPPPGCYCRPRGKECLNKCCYLEVVKAEKLTLAIPQSCGGDI
jgi:hypothetical protein